jgi:hypothetical protein
MALDHKDPFDRLLVAQAKVDEIPLVSADSELDPYGISCIWSLPKCLVVASSPLCFGSRASLPSLLQSICDHVILYV